MHQRRTVEKAIPVGAFHELQFFLLGFGIESLRIESNLLCYLSSHSLADWDLEKQNQHCIEKNISNHLQKEEHSDLSQTLTRKERAKDTELLSCISYPYSLGWRRGQ
jgi:hypothetical protein